MTMSKISTFLEAHKTSNSQKGDSIEAYCFSRIKYKDKNRKYLDRKIIQLQTEIKSESSQRSSHVIPGMQIS